MMYFRVIASVRNNDSAMHTQPPLTRTQPATAPQPGRPASQRSRITNGSALLSGVDGRSAWVRRARDLMEAHLDDLGGSDAVSEAERSIVRRASVLSVELERMESAFAAAGEASIGDLDAYQRAANSMRRLLESVGIKRRTRDQTPDLGDYLRVKAAGAQV